mmetsp:Transcript_47243/g.47686  ORF Transcript_47243/g.47686 Transcript_47243/m.47686 type:complete len:167 (-) Transcript_47243:171-671(-)
MKDRLSPRHRRTRHTSLRGTQGCRAWVGAPSSAQSIQLLNYNSEDCHGLPSNIRLIGEEGGKRLVTSAKSPVPRLWVINPCKVVYELLDQRLEQNNGSSSGSSKSSGLTYSSTAYGTLRGHLLCGEERVSVGIRDGGGGRNDYEQLFERKCLSKYYFFMRNYCAYA